jgi:hypothetical protein
MSFNTSIRQLEGCDHVEGHAKEQMHREVRLNHEDELDLNNFSIISNFLVFFRGNLSYLTYFN